jgi:glutamate 5-kinase
MHCLKTIRCAHNKIVVRIGTNLLAGKVKWITLDPMNESSRNVDRLNAFGSTKIYNGRLIVSSAGQSPASLPIGS